MSTLLDFRDGVKNFCSKYDKFVSPLCKFILALVVFWSINHLTGYNSTISSIVVVLAAAFVCAFLSGQLTLAIAGLYACAQVASASLELGISFVVIFVIMYCVYIRFFPKASWIDQKLSPCKGSHMCRDRIPHGYGGDNGRGRITCISGRRLRVQS